MSEVRKKQRQKQNPAEKGKGSEIVPAGPTARSPRLSGGSLQRNAYVCLFYYLTLAVVVIYGISKKRLLLSFLA
jgi:hypothetical protein